MSGGDGGSISFGDCVTLSSALYYGYVTASVQAGKATPLLRIEAHPQVVAHLKDKEAGRHGQDSHLTTLVLQPPRHFEKCVFEIVQPVDLSTTSLSSTLTYGQTIRLRHLFSRTYISLGGGRVQLDSHYVTTEERATTPRGRKRVAEVSIAELTAEEATQHTGQVFRILPKYSKIRKEGDGVRLGDQVIFQHVESGRVLAAGEVHDGPSDADTIEGKEGRSKRLGLLGTQKEHHMRLSAKRKEAEIWTLHPYQQGDRTRRHSEDEPGADVVHAGMVVSLHHVESDCFLAVSQPPVDKPDWFPRDLKVPSWGGQRKEGEVYVEPRTEMSSEFSSYASLWILERDDPNKGGPVSLHRPQKASVTGAHTYRLRHLGTDTYLSVTRPQSTSSMGLCTVRSRGERKNSSSLIRFLPDTSTVKSTPDDTCILGGHTLVRLQFATSKLLLHVRKNKETSLSNRVIYEDLFVIRPVPSSYSFSLAKVAEAVVALRMVLHVPPLTLGASPPDHQDDRFAAVGKAATNILESVQKDNSALWNKVPESGPSGFLCWQRILLDLQVHVLCFALLHWASHTSMSHVATESLVLVLPDVFDIMGELIKSSFAVLAQLCRQVPGTKGIAAAPYFVPWLPALCHLVGGYKRLPSKPNASLFSIRGMKLLLAVVKDQHEVVTMVHEDTVTQCIDLLLPHLADKECPVPSKEILQDSSPIAVLTSLCLCNGTGVLPNQQLVTKKVLDTANPFIYPTRSLGGAVEVLVVPKGEGKEMVSATTVPAMQSSTSTPRKRSLFAFKALGGRWVSLSSFLRHWPNDAVSYFASTRELLHSLSVSNPEGASLARECVGVSELLEGLSLGDVAFQYRLNPILSNPYPDHPYSDPLRAAYIRIARSAYLGHVTPTQHRKKKKMKGLIPPEPSIEERRHEWASVPPRYGRRNAIIAVSGAIASGGDVDVAMEHPDFVTVRALLAGHSLLRKMAGAVHEQVLDALTREALLCPLTCKAGDVVRKFRDEPASTMVAVVGGDLVLITDTGIKVSSPYLLGAEHIIPTVSEIQCVAATDVRAYTIECTTVLTVLRSCHKGFEIQLRELAKVIGLEARHTPKLVTALQCHAPRNMVSFGTGSVLYEEGDPAESMLILVHGGSKVHPTPDAHPLFLNIDGVLREPVGTVNHTYVATSSVTAVKVGQEDLVHMLRRSGQDTFDSVVSSTQNILDASINFNLVDTESDTSSESSETRSNDSDAFESVDPFHEEKWEWERTILVRGLKLSLKYFLSQNTRVQTSNVARNVLMAEWLQLLSTMMELGLYTTEEMDMVLPSLANILDPQTDDNVTKIRDKLDSSMYRFPHPLEESLNSVENASPLSPVDLHDQTINTFTRFLSDGAFGSTRCLSPPTNMSSPRLRSFTSKLPRPTLDNTIDQGRNQSEDILVTHAKLAVCQIFIKLLDDSSLPVKSSIEKLYIPPLPTIAGGAALIATRPRSGSLSSFDNRSLNASSLSAFHNGGNLSDILQSILLEVMKYRGSRDLFVISFRLYLLLSAVREKLPLTHPKARQGLVTYLCHQIGSKDEQCLLMRLLEHAKSYTHDMGGSLGGTSLTQDEEDETIIAVLGCLKDVIYTEGTDEYRTLQSRQNRLNELGAIQVVINTVDLGTTTKQHPPNSTVNTQTAQAPATLTPVTPSEEVVKCGLELAIALLEGGNLQVQLWLKDYFFSRKDETLFVVLRDRITNATCILDRAVAAAERIGQTESKSEDSMTDEDATTASPSGPLDLAAQPALPTFTGPLLHIEETMRFLQLCCEGHNTALQNYFRIQDDNVQSHDLVRETLKFLSSVLNTARQPHPNTTPRSRQATGVLCGPMSDFCLRVAIQTWNTLTEFCQGPVPANQMTLVEGWIGKDVNKVFVVSGRPELVAELQNAAALTLLSVVEGCTTPYAPISLRQTLDLKLLMDTITSSSEEDMEHLDFGYNVYLLLCFLRDYDKYDPTGVSLGALLDQSTVMQFYKTRTARVEIMREGTRLERVYFRLPNKCLRLSHRTRAQLLEKVNRDTQQTRLVDFFDRVEETAYEFELIDKLKRGGSGPGAFVHRWAPYAALMGNSLVLVANLLLMFVCSPDHTPGTLRLTMAELNEGVLIPVYVYRLHNLVCVLLVLLAVFQLIDFSYFKGPVLVFTRKNEKLRRAGKYSVAEYMASGVTEATSQTADVLRKCLLEPPFLRLMLTVWSGAISCLISPFVVSILLLPLVAESAVIRHVFRAVTRNGRSLVLTMLLGVVLLYLFSVIGFVKFRHMFDDGDHQNCSSMLRCFIFTVSNGLRAGGGIGELLQSPPWGSEYHALRVAYDLSFFILITVIFMNILFGIIVDTFGELRQKREARELEMGTRCFICNIESGDFDKRADGFVNHVKRDHNMWNYMFFVYYLKHKSYDELTGQESFVHSCLCKNDLRFIPVNRSLALEQDAMAGTEGDWAFRTVGLQGGREEHDSEFDLADIGMRLESLENKMMQCYTMVEEQLTHIVRDLKQSRESRRGDPWEKSIKDGMKETIKGSREARVRTIPSIPTSEEIEREKERDRGPPSLNLTAPPSMGMSSPPNKKPAPSPPPSPRTKEGGKDDAKLPQKASQMGVTSPALMVSRNSSISSGHANLDPQDSESPQAPLLGPGQSGGSPATPAWEMMGHPGLPRATTEMLLDVGCMGRTDSMGEAYVEALNSSIMPRDDVESRLGRSPIRAALLMGSLSPGTSTDPVLPQRQETCTIESQIFGHPAIPLEEGPQSPVASDSSNNSRAAGVLTENTSFHHLQPSAWFLNASFGMSFSRTESPSATLIGDRELEDVDFADSVGERHFEGSHKSLRGSSFSRKSTRGVGYSLVVRIVVAAGGVAVCCLRCFNPSLRFGSYKESPRIGTTAVLRRRGIDLHLASPESTLTVPGTSSRPARAPRPSIAHMRKQLHDSTRKWRKRVEALQQEKAAEEEEINEVLRKLHSLRAGSEQQESKGNEELLRLGSGSILSSPSASSAALRSLGKRKSVSFENPPVLSRIVVPPPPSVNIEAEYCDETCSSSSDKHGQIVDYPSLPPPPPPPKLPTLSMSPAREDTVDSEEPVSTRTVVQRQPSSPLSTVSSDGPRRALTRQSSPNQETVKHVNERALLCCSPPNLPQEAERPPSPLQQNGMAEEIPKVDTEDKADNEDKENKEDTEKPCEDPTDCVASPDTFGEQRSSFLGRDSQNGLIPRHPPKLSHAAVTQVQIKDLAATSSPSSSPKEYTRVHSNASSTTPWKSATGGARLSPRPGSNSPVDEDRLSDSGSDLPWMKSYRQIETEQWCDTSSVGNAPPHRASSVWTSFNKSRRNSLEDPQLNASLDWIGYDITTPSPEIPRRLPCTVDEIPLIRGVPELHSPVMRGNRTLTSKPSIVLSKVDGEETDLYQDRRKSEASAIESVESSSSSECEQYAALRCVQAFGRGAICRARLYNIMVLKRRETGSPAASVSDASECSGSSLSRKVSVEALAPSLSKLHGTIPPRIRR